jgi:hypothetical protein
MTIVQGVWGLVMEVMELNYSGPGSVRYSNGGQLWWFRECEGW